jgi:hypothetical protein
MLKKLTNACRFGMIALGLAGLSSCDSERGSDQYLVSPSALAPSRGVSDSSERQMRCTTPKEAGGALVVATKARDTNDMRLIFGPELQGLVSPDAVQAGNAFSNFARRVSEKIDYVYDSGYNKVELQLGMDAWPFPIPLVKDNGEWYFDTAAGREEILNRRIGMNELAAIRVCRAYVEAQREYASQPRNGDDIFEYAQHFRSTTNTHDGLYWHAAPGEAPSPFGPLIVQARDEGYHQATKMMGSSLVPYRGYCFQILTRQGSHAPAGKYDYIINGHMLAGFALAAWPAQWGNTGVMTFIVNQQGKVYQKNLGPRTVSIASEMTTYDPDKTWKPVAGN